MNTLANVVIFMVGLASAATLPSNAVVPPTYNAYG